MILRVNRRTLTRLLALPLVVLISMVVYFSRPAPQADVAPQADLAPQPDVAPLANLAPPASLVRVGGDAEIFLGDSFPPSAAVFFFLRSDCPIGNRYAPKIAQIATEFRDSGYAFQLVYPDDSPEKIKRHQEEFGLAIDAYHDPEHALVRRLGITRAPEAVVIDQSGRQVYRGRIDDQFVDFGKSRRAATTDDLREVLSALTRGETVVPKVTQAVGCYIE